MEKELQELELIIKRNCKKFRNCVKGMRRIQRNPDFENNQNLKRKMDIKMAKAGDYNELVLISLSTADFLRII